MFIGRKSELETLTKAMKNGNSAVLLYGRRRFGKTSLIKEALKSFDGIAILYTCRQMSLKDNARRCSSLISNALGISLELDSFDAIFQFLAQRNEQFAIALDEYQDLKKREDGYLVDSVFRDTIDFLSDNVTVILSGSSIRMMSELNNADNPLFCRFTDIINIKEMGYLESSFFYPNYSIGDKIIAYSVFGGIPLLNKMIDQSKSIAENIISLFIDENGGARNYVKSVVDIEIQSIPDALIIMSTLGNGKRKFSELQSAITNISGKNQLARTLNRLLDADLIRKVSPINTDNRKLAFYEISNNALRFYFAYIFNTEDFLAMSSSDIYKKKIQPSINTFVSYRFESIARTWFFNMSKCGKIKGILRVGSYWYDDKANHKNGEFDVALHTENGYEIYECKFLKDKMSRALAIKEKQKANAIKGINIARFGLISSSGFEDNIQEMELITGEDLYRIN